MKVDVLKEASIEYCDNIYALAVNYLKENSNSELIYLMNELAVLKNDIRFCYDEELLDGYKMILEHLVNKIEGIINE